MPFKTEAAARKVAAEKYQEHLDDVKRYRSLASQAPSHNASVEFSAKADAAQKAADDIKRKYL